MAFQQKPTKEKKKSQYAASICSSWGTTDPVTVAKQLLSPPPSLYTHTPLFYSKCIAKTAGQSSLTVSKCTWGVSIHHTLYIVSVLIWHKPVLPMSAWRFFFFSGPDIGLVSFRLCICSLVHTVLDLNQPPPSLSVIHRSCILCTKNENYYWELFCLYGGGPFFFLFFFRKNEPTLAQLRFGESRLKI